MSKPSSIGRRILKGLAGFALGVIMLFTIYVVMLWRHTRQVRDFCHDVPPGTPVVDLLSIAGRHGIDPGWLRGREKKDPGRTFFFVPIAETIGEEGCAVEHDGKTVLAARFDGVF